MKGKGIFPIPTLASVGGTGSYCLLPRHSLAGGGFLDLVCVFGYWVAGNNYKNVDILEFI